jgi:hypothetical protein
MKCKICGCSDNKACEGGCSWVEPNLCSNCEEKRYSQNERAKEIVGLRRTDCQPFDFPSELGYICPKNKNHRLEWSEYNGFIWCEDCNLDIPSCLCLKDIKRATDIYLDCLEDLKKAKNK